MDDLLLNPFVTLRYFMVDIEPLHHFISQVLNSCLISIARRPYNLLSKVISRFYRGLVLDISVLFNLL